MPLIFFTFLTNAFQEYFKSLRLSAAFGIGADVEVVDGEVHFEVGENIGGFFEVFGVGEVEANSCGEVVHGAAARAIASALTVLASFIGLPIIPHEALIADISIAYVFLLCFADFIIF